MGLGDRDSPQLQLSQGDGSVIQPFCPKLLWEFLVRVFGRETRGRYMNRSLLQAFIVSEHFDCGIRQTQFVHLSSHPLCFHRPLERVASLPSLEAVSRSQPNSPDVCKSSKTVKTLWAARPVHGQAGSDHHPASDSVTRGLDLFLGTNVRRSCAL
jgi:hypothetical protein